MAIPPYQYSTGTVSVVDGETTVTQTGVGLWTRTNARRGDWIAIDGLRPVPVLNNLDNISQIEIPPWQDGDKSDVTYIIYWVAPRRTVGVDAIEDVDALVGALNTQGYFVYVAPDQTEPDPSLGIDGQFALKMSTGERWEKVGGVWISRGIAAPLYPAENWDIDHQYHINSFVVDDDIAYVGLADNIGKKPATNPDVWLQISAAGTAATIGIGTITTGAGGSAASVTNVGTPNAAVLDMTIPRGKSYDGTSTTSMTIAASGNVTFATQAGLAYLPGARIRLSETTTLHWMEIILSTYVGTAMTGIISASDGDTGTYTAWNLNIAGLPGAGTGDMKKSDNLVGMADPKASLDNISVHGADIASAATLNLEAATGYLIDVTGTTNITAITLGEGHRRVTRFTDACKITGGASLRVPYAGADYTTTPGDIIEWVGYAGGVVRCATFFPANQTVARSSIYAAPFDALAYNGMQINGSMEVSQELGTTARTSGYVIDGYNLFTSGTMVVSGQQVTDAPPGYSNSLKFSVTTAQASLGSNDQAIITIAIEGYRVKRLGWGVSSAQPLVIGFWVKAHRAGLYSGVIRNNAVNRFYPYQFTVNLADTWEFKTVSINGDQTGTWEKGNLIGLNMIIAIAAGTTRQGIANVWSASLVAGTTGTTNGVAATSDTFQITGLIMLPGIELPSADRASFIMRPFDQELFICQRYYETSYTYGINPGSSNHAGEQFIIADSGAVSNPRAGTTWYYKVQKRASPTVTYYSPNTGASGKVFDGNSVTDVTPSTINTSINSVAWFATSVGSNGHQFRAHFVADARL